MDRCYELGGVAGIDPGQYTLRELIPLARGAWVRMFWGALLPYGRDMDLDPFSLMDDGDGRAGVLPYDPAVMQALQDGGMIG